MSILKKLAKRRKKLSKESTFLPPGALGLPPGVTVPPKPKKKLRTKMVTEVDGDWQC